MFKSLNSACVTQILLQALNLRHEYPAALRALGAFMSHVGSVKRLEAVAFAALVILLNCAVPAWASVETDIFGSSSPLEKFAGFLTGPFAFFIALVAFVAFGFMLAVGNDFSGFSRRVPTTIVGVAFVVLAVNAVNFLFSGMSAGAVLLPGEVPHVW